MILNFVITTTSDISEMTNKINDDVIVNQSNMIICRQSLPLSRSSTTHIFACSGCTNVKAFPAFHSVE